MVGETFTILLSVYLLLWCADVYGGWDYDPVLGGLVCLYAREGRGYWIRLLVTYLLKSQLLENERSQRF